MKTQTPVRHPLVFSLAVLAAFTLSPLLAADADPAPAAAAVNGLAAKLQKKLPATTNTLLSPWSLQSVLAMLYAGADKPVAAEMSVALSLPQYSPALDASFRSLRESIFMPAEGAPPLLLRSANRVVTQTGIPLGADWLVTLRTDYAADAVQMDFAKGAGTAVKEINAWVNAQTEGKIPKLLEELDPSTQVVLLNAVYLDMVWEERFTKELTTDQPFHISAAKQKTVALMFKQHRMRFAQKPGFKIAALPYAGGLMQFAVLVPDAITGLSALEKTLTPLLLSECTKLPVEEVRLSLPRLKMEFSPANLIETLESFGMKKAFREGGFARIGPQLSVSQVVHKTFLDLDEDGSKAAAATGLAMKAANGVPHEIPHKVVRADRPFLFMIQHVPSGACLFLGRCIDPAPDVAAAPDAMIKKAANAR